MGKLVSFCVLSKLSYSALNLSENPIKNLIPSMPSIFSELPFPSNSGNVPLLKYNSIIISGGAIGCLISTDARYSATISLLNKYADS